MHTLDRPLDRRAFEQAWKAWFSSDLDPAGPAWLQWVLTGIFCAVIALCFTVLGMAMNALGGGGGWSSPSNWLFWYGKNLAVSLVIGYLIHALFQGLIPLVGKARIRGWSNAQRGLFFSAVPIVGVMIGWPLGVWLVQPDAGWLARAGTNGLVGSFLFSVVICFVFFQIFNAKSRQAVAERQAVEAQLRLLQAQIEPHFLFNTLAAVQTLIDADPARAKGMLESFTDYLRATLASLRTADSTLQQELDLAAAYLALMQQRMEDRLAFSIDADPALRAMPMPPLLLQPLVENAVHHGLEPKVEGGRVHVTARREGDALRLEVRDDGDGPQAPRRRPGGQGMALENISQRLQGRWGDRARLELAPARPGTVATLVLPLEGPTP